MDIGNQAPDRRTPSSLPMAGHVRTGSVDLSRDLLAPCRRELNAVEKDGNCYEPFPWYRGYGQRDDGRVAEGAANGGCDPQHSTERGSHT